MEGLPRSGKEIVDMSSKEIETAATSSEEAVLGEMDEVNPTGSILLEEHSSIAEEGWPSGTSLPLNSKCLNLVKWHAIAASLDLSTDATLTETCVIVEGKLTELGHEPVGVQAILSDTDKSLLYLVDKGGIIKTVNMSAHVSNDDSHDYVERSALHDTADLERLHQVVSEHESTTETLQSELQIACANVLKLY